MTTSAEFVPALLDGSVRSATSHAQLVSMGKDVTKPVAAVTMASATRPVGSVCARLAGPDPTAQKNALQDFMEQTVGSAACVRMEPPVTRPMENVHVPVDGWAQPVNWSVWRAGSGPTARSSVNVRMAASVTDRLDSAAAVLAGLESVVRKLANQACLVPAVRRDVSVCTEHHVTMSLESVSVQQGGEENSVTKHVCRVCMGRVACSTVAVLRVRPATTSLETAAVLLDSQETAVNRLVFQEHMDRTVTRSVSAQRQTSSATQCLDHVTALQVSMAPNVTKYVERVAMVQTVKTSASVKMMGGAFLPLEPVNVWQDL